MEDEVAKIIFENEKGNCNAVMVLTAKDGKMSADMKFIPKMKDGEPLPLYAALAEHYMEQLTKD